MVVANVKDARWRMTQGRETDGKKAKPEARPALDPLLVLDTLDEHDLPQQIEQLEAVHSQLLTQLNRTRV